MASKLDKVIAKLSEWLLTDEGQEFAMGTVLCLIGWDEARETILRVTGYDMGEFEAASPNGHGFDNPDVQRIFLTVVPKLA